MQSIKFSCSVAGNLGKTLKVSLVNSDQLQILLLNVIEMIGISMPNLKGNFPPEVQEMTGCTWCHKR